MRRRLLQLAALLALALVMLIAVVVLNTARMPSRQLQVEPVQVPTVDPAAVQRLSRSLTFRTLSSQDGEVDGQAFTDFQLWLLDQYPGFYRVMDVDLVQEHSVIATWKGRDPSLPHVVLLAHQDVVPIADPSRWTHEPFSGQVVDGFVWGRGAIDDKGSLLALHEAVSRLTASGFTPERTLHFVFSHDEELGGSGARAASTWLRERSIEVEAIYDEGLIIADGLIPGIPGKVGLIGVVERGYATFEVVAKGRDGHASMPPPEGGTAVAVLASAIRRLEENPRTPSLEGPADQLFDWVGPEMDPVNRAVFANRWLLGPVIVGQMTGKASTNASLRTTFAPTMLRASPQENVLPAEAAVTVNFRLHPRDSIQGIQTWLEQTIDDDRISVRLLGEGNEPSATASIDSRAFRALQHSFAEVFPGMPVAPGLFVAATDSRWLQEHTDDIYRFQPVPTTSEDLGRIHGVDERIAIEDWGRMIVLYERLLQHAGSSGAP